MPLKDLVPLPVRDRFRPFYYGWIKWPKPLWRLRGRGGFTIAGHRFEMVDVAKDPHDWWAWRARKNVYEREVSAFLAAELREGDVFFDVGVYMGVYSLLGAVEVGERGRVVSFEPDPSSQLIARRNFALNRVQSKVHLVAAAVGDTNGVMVLAPEHLGKSTSTSGSGAGAGTFEVRGVRLDDWCEEAGVWPDVIKMDIEGAEAAALGEASRRAVEHARLVVLEIHEDAITEQGGEVQRIYDFLTSTGKAIQRLEARREDNFNVAAVRQTVS